MKLSYCDDCRYLDKTPTEQPCCGCVDGLLLEPSEDASCSATSNTKEGATLNAHSNMEEDMDKFYWYKFTDGHRVCVRGFSKQELAVEERKHGKLVSMVAA